MHTMLDLLRKHLRPGDCFIDIGAGNGVPFTFPASGLVGPTGLVVAIESDRQCFQRLQHNVGFANKSNIRCFNLSSSDHCIDGPAPQRRIDALCCEEQLTRVSLIKVSAPGAELATMSGIGELILRPNAPTIIFEIQQGGDQSREITGRLEDLMEAADYNVDHYGSFIAADAPLRSTPSLTRSHSTLRRFSEWCKAASPPNAGVTHA